MVRNVLRLVLAVNSVSKPLNRVEKIPICVVVNCDAPKPGCLLITRQPAEHSWMSGNLPDIHENRAESPLYGELYPNTKHVPNSSQ